MKEKFPEIFKTKIDNVKSKVQNEYYFRGNSKNQDDMDIRENNVEKPDRITLLNKINDIFKRPDFVYQYDITIMYKNGETINQRVIGMKENYLITITGEKIFINDIYDIK